MLDFNGNEPKEIRYDDGIKLPDGYTRLEYIESTGTQWIDTGIKSGSDVKIKSKFASTNIEATRNYVFGVYNQNKERMQFSYVADMFLGYGDKYNTIQSNIDMNKHTIQLYNGVFTLDEQIIQTLSANNFKSSSKNIFLFAVNGTSAMSYSYIKMYETQMLKNNTLMCNFIPAKRNSNNEVGLYDIVNDVFYTNQGTGSFVAGNEYKGYNVSKVVYNNTVVWKGLPSTYTRLEYIESTGTQYIDTGITGKSNLKIETKIWNMLNASKQLFGSRIGPTNQALYLNFQKENSYNGWSFAYYNSYLEDSTIKFTSIPHTIIIDDCDIYYDNTHILHGSHTEFNNNLNMYLFTLNNNGTAHNQSSSIKLYYFKIYDNNILVRNYIPAKRNVDNEVGLYDTVTDTFYTNAGTGTFIAGEYNKVN